MQHADAVSPLLFLVVWLAAADVESGGADKMSFDGVVSASYGYSSETH